MNRVDFFKLLMLKIDYLTMGLDRNVEFGQKLGRMGSRNGPVFLFCFVFLPYSDVITIL